MQIGELSRRTGASPRSLRYYEQQGLLTSARRENDYREYPANAVAVVDTIRVLLKIGLPTTIIGEVLPCVIGEKSEAACPDLLARIESLQQDVRSRAARLASIEASLDAFLAANR